ncbi:hypothetical protein ACFFLS_11705 [Flavobacterium procerum]|uniref:Uncharacterized protein n=1 Tax=Flavobacterium procerum TaxID=1455569 RepID=A0ABV6BQI6_9FLAO
MKKIILILVMIFISCKRENDEYDRILKSLEKNYVNSELPRKDLLLCFQIDSTKFHNDSIEYKKAILLFYKQKQPFIEYLMKNKNQSNRYNNWIFTTNPCSSTLEENDYISNSKGSIILIDNLLIGDHKNIIINDYTHKIDYKTLESIIEENQDQSYQELRADYIKYLEELR